MRVSLLCANETRYMAKTVGNRCDRLCRAAAANTDRSFEAMKLKELSECLHFIYIYMRNGCAVCCVQL